MILRTYRVILVGLVVFATGSYAVAADSEWLPFRTEVRGELVKWEQDNADLNRSVGALEVAIPLYKNLFAGPIVTIGKLDVKKLTPEFTAQHRLGFGATIQYRNIDLFDDLRIHLITRADGQRQRLTDNMPLGAGTITQKQTVTAYHVTGIGELEWSAAGWEIAPYAGVIGDRIEREVSLDNFTTKSRDWSGLQPYGGVRFGHWFDAYYAGLRCFAGGGKRIGIELSVGHDGAREQVNSANR